MDRIEGKPEGRPGVWLITPEMACVIVDDLPGDTVHNFIDAGMAMIGADWQKADFHDFIEKGGKKLALVFPPNGTMKHQLVAINDEERWAFDVGEIPESRMTEAPCPNPS